MCQTFSISASELYNEHRGMVGSPMITADINVASVQDVVVLLIAVVKVVTVLFLSIIALKLS